MQKQTCRLTLSLYVTTLVPAVAVADVTTDISHLIREQFGTTITTTFNEDSQQSTVTGTVMDAINGPQNSSISPNTAVQASPGVLKAEVNAEANFPGAVTLSSSGTAFATWTARPVINVKGVAPGVAGTAKALMDFSGGFSYRNNGYSTRTFYSGNGVISLELNADGENGFAKYDALYRDPIFDPNNRGFRIEFNRTGAATSFPFNETNPGTSESYTWDRDVAVSFDFITGRPFDLFARLTVGGTAGVQDSGRLEWKSTAMNTASWGGLFDVQIGGQAAADFTAIDEFTGLELAGPIAPPIPVPAAIWLFGSGLLGLIGFARVKKR